MVAIIKHTNPCGTAIGDRSSRPTAGSRRRPVSAFGGVIGVNREVDAEAAEEIAKLFVEAVAAPRLHSRSPRPFRGQKEPAPHRRNLGKQPASSSRSPGGFLLQDADNARVSASDLKVATCPKPTEAEIEALLFAWRVCKHVKSNAIVYARDGQTWV